MISIQLSSNVREAVSGEVVHFDAQALDKDGDVIEKIPFVFSFTGACESPSEYASGLIKEDGNFVANVSGIYTIFASFGGREAQCTLQVSKRDVAQKVQLKAVSYTHLTLPTNREV